MLMQWPKGTNLNFDYVINHARRVGVVTINKFNSLLISGISAPFCLLSECTYLPQMCGHTIDLDNRLRLKETSGMRLAYECGKIPQVQ